jgi:ATP-dependent Clp protease ATP-binding subunit ClpA
MFERFTGEARDVVANAQDEARALRHPFIGTEHLLLAMLTTEGVGGELLTARGMDADAVRRQLREWDGGADSNLDPEALATLGIDLDEVRRAAEERFGPGALAANARPMPKGHIPFTRRAKKVLELALYEAGDLNSNSINSGHMLLGVIREKSGIGARLIRDAGIDVDELSAECRVRAAHRAA